MIASRHLKLHLVRQQRQDLSISQAPSLLFTPSTPRPQAGHPNPFAITGGSESGKDAAEKKVMPRVGCPVFGTDGGIIRFCVARSTFSGIERKEGIEYLKRKEKEFVMRSSKKKGTCVFTMVPLSSHSNPSFSLSGHVVG
jgi:hypothetical protein